MSSTINEPANELVFLPANELARRIRMGELSARQVMAAHLAQIERVNPQVNAIVTLDADQALAGAAAADEAQAHGAVLGPLHGLPVAHKDLVETKGMRTTFGSPIFKDFVPARNALIVERIQQAGAITIGKTNTPEFGAGSQTFNQVFGATRNPYDLSKTCGGSDSCKFDLSPNRDAVRQENYGRKRHQRGRCARQWSRWTHPQGRCFWRGKTCSDSCQQRCHPAKRSPRHAELTSTNWPIHCDQNRIAATRRH